jgi:hypothetical protein
MTAATGFLKAGGEKFHSALAQMRQLKTQEQGNREGLSDVKLFRKRK